MALALLSNKCSIGAGLWARVQAGGSRHVCACGYTQAFLDGLSSRASPGPGVRAARSFYFWIYTSGSPGSHDGVYDPHCAAARCGSQRLPLRLSLSHLVTQIQQRNSGKSRPVAHGLVRTYIFVDETLNRMVSAQN